MVRFRYQIASCECCRVQPDFVQAPGGLHHPRLADIRVMLLDRDGILRALTALDDDLGRAGVRGELFVEGGAAMALADDSRRATVDVDAAFLPAAEVRKAAQRVADELGLEPDWLNDCAKALMPGTILTRSLSTRAPI